MSVNDILYAPIGQPNTGPDFIVFRNDRSSFDWKPMTSRAGNWSTNYFPDEYQRSMNTSGWMQNFAATWGLKNLTQWYLGARWLEDLIRDQFVFEQVDVPS